MHNGSAIMPHIGAEPTDSQASTRRFEDQLVYELKIQQVNLVSGYRNHGRIDDADLVPECRRISPTGMPAMRFWAASVRTGGCHEPVERIDAAMDAGVRACAVTATLA